MSEEIKSRAFSEQGRKNYDHIFVKKSAHKWAEESGIKILDPDGFRWDDGVNMDSLISYSEFQKRLNHCTIIFGPFIQKADQFPHLFK
jgi:hypothetical protein